MACADLQAAHAVRDELVRSALDRPLRHGEAGAVAFAPHVGPRGLDRNKRNLLLSPVDLDIRIARTE
jgi:hypothetical protein